MFAVGALRKSLPLLVLALATSSGGGCKKDDKGKSAAKETSGQNEGDKGTATQGDDADKALPKSDVITWYRVELLAADDTPPIPFYLHLPARGNDAEAELQKGAARMHLPVTWNDDKSFDIRFEIFDSSLSGTLDAKGNIKGTWQQSSGSWGEAKLDMRATKAEKPDFGKLFASDDGATPNKIAGNWKLELDESGETALELNEYEGGIAGVIRFASGNITALAGNAVGNQLQLSGFDGTSVYLLRADIADDKTLENGQWIAGSTLGWREGFSGSLDKDFSLANIGPSLSEGAKGIEIGQVDLSAYEGKPTIVELAGSWCITCRYAAPFLVEVYEEFHPKGLEIVTLTYEFTDDEIYNKDKSDAFKSEYKIPWQVTPVNGDVADIATLLPKNLEGVDISGFPISIFVGKDGAVQHIHAGFPVDKKSESYEHTTAEYKAKVEKLLE